MYLQENSRACADVSDSLRYPIAGLAGQSALLPRSTRQERYPERQGSLSGREFGLEIFPGDALVASFTESLIHLDKIQSVFDHAHKLFPRGCRLAFSMGRK